MQWRRRGCRCTRGQWPWLDAGTKIAVDERRGRGALACGETEAAFQVLALEHAGLFEGTLVVSVCFLDVLLLR